FAQRPTDTCAVVARDARLDRSQSRHDIALSRQTPIMARSTFLARQTARTRLGRPRLAQSVWWHGIESIRRAAAARGLRDIRLEYLSEHGIDHAGAAAAKIRHPGTTAGIPAWHPV